MAHFQQGKRADTCSFIGKHMPTRQTLSRPCEPDEPVLVDPANRPRNTVALVHHRAELGKHWECETRSVYLIPKVKGKTAVQFNWRPVGPTRGWSLGVLNHVALATKNLETSSAFYRDLLQAKVSAPLALPEHRVTTVFVELGNTKLELLQPLGSDSPIEKFLIKKPEGGIHHVCFEVDNVVAALQDLTARGIRSLDKEPKTGAHGKPVIFLHPKDCHGILIELEQRD